MSEQAYSLALEDAVTFLNLLAGSENANFTFQTFDDKKTNDTSLIKMLHGTFEECQEALVRLNNKGAGIFVTVNETDLKGRSKGNIKKIRAIFVDLDGSPLEPILSYEQPPHIIVESSPGKWHAYWLIDNLPLSEFESHQRALASFFAGDPVVHDLPRVMRLPGFIHQKDEPFLTRIEEINNNPRYEAEAVSKTTPEGKKASTTGRRGVGDANRLNDMALDNLEVWVPAIFPDARPRNGSYRISSQMLGRELEEDLSITPNGIKDFGVHDMGDKKDGARTPIDLVQEYLGKSFNEAMQWLRDKLGFGGVQLEDFWAFMPSHTYIYSPTGEQWPASSVNSRLPPVLLFNRNGEPIIELNKKGEPVTKIVNGEEVPKQKTMAPNIWLDRNKPVEQMTWAPGEPLAVKDRLILEGGWVDRIGVTCFNQYKAPTIKHGDKAQAKRWVDHVMRVYPEEGEHIISYLAQRVQHPEIKINHALVLGGEPGIGKDTMLEPAKQAIGPWNFSEITPQNLLGAFNGFVKSVILRISEARDLEVNRYQFYEHSKIYMASPPDVLRCNEKHLREHSILNCCGVIITTNYKTDGIYLPPNDRRHFVAWSESQKETFDDEYWNELWSWYRNDGGFNHIAAYLASLDLSTFDPKAPPPKTSAFWDIVNANRAPEDAELGAIIEELNFPNAITIDMVINKTGEGSFRDWLTDRKNRRAIPHRFEQCDYTAVRNDDAKDGFWKVGGKRQVVYALKKLDVKSRIHAARFLTGVVNGGIVTGKSQGVMPEFGDDIPFDNI